MYSMSFISFLDSGCCKQAAEDLDFVSRQVELNV